MLKPWPTISSKPLGDYRIFKVRSDEKLSPRTGQKHDFFVIDCVDWVNIIAITSDQQLVMVERRELRPFHRPRTQRRQSNDWADPCSTFRLLPVRALTCPT